MPRPDNHLAASPLTPLIFAIAVADFPSLQCALAKFRVWYNYQRPHYHLAGRTPFEAWYKIDPYRRPPKEVHYLTAWDGLLTGYWLRY